MPKCLLLTGLIVLFPLTTFASFESDIIAATNQERLDASSSALTENALLSQIAAARAARMAETQNFSHTDSDGHNAWYWIKEGGYTFTRAGENIAVNFNDASSAVEKWMNSEGHRANILNAQFEEIGVGTAEGMYKGATSTYIVQLFGTRANATKGVQQQVLGEGNNVAYVAAVTTPQNAAQGDRNVTLPSPNTPPLKPKLTPKIDTTELTSVPFVLSQTATAQTHSVPSVIPKIVSMFLNLLTFLW